MDVGGEEEAGLLEVVQSLGTAELAFLTRVFVHRFGSGRFNEVASLRAPGRHIAVTLHLEKVRLPS